jgi:hypothetical protein
MIKLRTAHIRFNFGRYFRRPKKPFLKALLHAEFYDSRAKKFRSSFLKKYRAELIDSTVAIATFLFSVWLMFWTFQYKDGQMVMLGRVWSDFAAHIPLIRSFSMGNNFPPEYPTFPGEPIRYHYLFFLVVGLLEKIGFNIAWALNIPSTIGLWLLLWMIYHTTLTLFRSRKAAILSIFLFLLNGTWSILEFVKKSNSIDQLFTKIISAPEYASFGPWDGKIVSAFWNWNIYLNQRHLALSFGVALALCYPLLRSALDKHFKLNRIWYPFIYVGFILFPLLHQAGYVMSVGWCLIWSLAFFKKLPKKLLVIYAWSFGFSLLTHFGLTQNTKQHTEIAFGYLAQEKTLWGITKYWLYNLGFYSFLLPIIFVFAKPKIRWFFLPFIGFFVLANVFQLSTDMINNHKLINYVTIGGNIVVAGTFLVLWRKHWSLKPLIIALTLLITASGIADIFPVINNHFLYQADYPQSETQQWIKKNTPPNVVFLSNEFIFNPASIVGRKLFIDYGYFNWSMGYPDGERRELLKSFFSADIFKSDLCNLLVENNIRYVHISNVHGTKEYDMDTSTLFTQFNPQYSTEKDEYIYIVSQNCQ